MLLFLIFSTNYYIIIVVIEAQFDVTLLHPPKNDGNHKVIIITTINMKIINIVVFVVVTDILSAVFTKRS